MAGEVGAEKRGGFWTAHHPVAVRMCRHTHRLLIERGVNAPVRETYPTDPATILTLHRQLLRTPALLGAQSTQPVGTLDRQLRRACARALAPLVHALLLTYPTHTHTPQTGAEPAALALQVVVVVHGLLDGVGVHVQHEV